jgi:hypothetical protein
VFNLEPHGSEQRKYANIEWIFCRADQSGVNT